MVNWQKRLGVALIWVTLAGCAHSGSECRNRDLLSEAEAQDLTEQFREAIRQVFVNKPRIGRLQEVIIRSWELNERGQLLVNYHLEYDRPLPFSETTDQLSSSNLVRHELDGVATLQEQLRQWKLQWIQAQHEHLSFTQPLVVHSSPRHTDLKQGD